MIDIVMICFTRALVQGGSVQENMPFFAGKIAHGIFNNA